MFLIMRAVIYVSLFVGLVLVFLPSRVLSWAGIVPPASKGLPQVIGMLSVVAGAGLALWCVVTFAADGRGTPAPFDPPRRLVISGPYRFVRNPMYSGAGIVLAGAALFYGSLGLLAYLGLLFLSSHLFILFHEEPRLKRTFGQEYDEYCRKVRRWIPKI